MYNTPPYIMYPVSVHVPCVLAFACPTNGNPSDFGGGHGYRLSTITKSVEFGGELYLGGEGAG